MSPFALPGGRISGDTFPLFRDGVCHLFHMDMPGIGHRTSRDLLTWVEHAPVVERGASGAPDDANIATGTVLEHAGRFWCFYTGNQNVRLATSDDLETWTKHPKNPVLVADGVTCMADDFRDPYVFRHAGEGRWWMLLGTRRPGIAQQRGGCVVLAVSDDLMSWRLDGRLWTPDLGPHADCPQLIETAGRWWLLHLQRTARWCHGPSSRGPFTPGGTLGTWRCAAGSRPAWDGKRWISLPWLFRPAHGGDLDEPVFGGPLAVPRELIFRADGGVDERPAPQVFAALGDATTTAREIDGPLTWLPDVPADAWLDLELQLPAQGDASLLLRCGDDLLTGYRLVLSPGDGVATLRPLGRWDLDHDLATRAIEVPAGGHLPIMVAISGGFLEAFIAGRWSLSAWIGAHRSGSIAIETATVIGARWWPADPTIRTDTELI